MIGDVVLVLAAYLVGSIPFGYVLPRLLRGDDIRRHGSGNVGATNVWRVYGRSLGLPVAILDVAKGLVLNPEVIRRNLAEHLPFMAVETILMHAVSRGGDRQQLHERLRRHSIEAAQQMKEGDDVDLLGRIAADRAFGLSRADLDRLADAARYVGRAPEQVARFLEEHVAPVLSSRRERTPNVAEAALHV